MGLGLGLCQNNILTVSLVTQRIMRNHSSTTSLVANEKVQKTVPTTGPMNQSINHLGAKFANIYIFCVGTFGVKKGRSNSLTRDGRVTDALSRKVVIGSTRENTDVG